MERKIGIIANDIQLKQTIEMLNGDEIKQGKILIELLDSDKIDEQGKLLEQKGAKVIIGRSVGYIHTVEMKVIDMLESQGLSKNDIAKALGISRSSLWNKINSYNQYKSKK